MVKTGLPATERVVGFVEPSIGYFIIPSEQGDIELASTLLPAMTQDKLATYSQEGFHALSIPEHFELFDDLYTLRDKGGEVENARQFVRRSIRHFLTTLTRLLYQPEGNDRVIHGYGTKSPVEKQVDLVGQDGNILEVLTPEVSLALTGKTPEQVAELMKYINGTKAYVWRLNNKPKSIEERVARFDAGSGKAYLSCSWSPQGSSASLGVRLARKILESKL